MMDPQERPRPTQEKMTTVKWVLCSPNFEDIGLITPKDLNNTPVMSQYKEISMKQIQIGMPQDAPGKKKKHKTTHRTIKKTENN